MELARAVAADAKIIILDEPTASLSGQESEKLFDILKDLRASGHALIYVSHRLAEVIDLADRTTVLRDGKLAGTLERGPEMTEQSMVKLMVGRALDISGFTKDGAFSDVNFKVRRGEILGLAGMVGAGRTEVARCIVGADALTSGKIKIDG